MKTLITGTAGFIGYPLAKTLLELGHEIVGYDIKNLSYLSSSSVYGLNKSQPFKTTNIIDRPISLYSTTKKSNKLMAHTYSHLYGIKFFMEKIND